MTVTLPKQDPAGLGRVKAARAHRARSQADACRLHELVILGVGDLPTRPDLP